MRLPQADVIEHHLLHHLEGIMRPRRLGLASLIAVAMVLIGSPAAAQPYAWVVDFTFAHFPLPPYRWLVVVNLATADRVSAVGLPEGITIGEGTLTSDGAHYLLSTSVGIARIRTATGQLEGVFGPSVQ